MNQQVSLYLEKFPAEVTEMFLALRDIICGSTEAAITETLWAKLPSYYVGDSFIRLIAFKDHINVEAKAIVQHKDELKGFKITPKGMLQIYTNQNIPTEILKKVFAETLNQP